MHDGKYQDSKGLTPQPHAEAAPSVVPQPVGHPATVACLSPIDLPGLGLSGPVQPTLVENNWPERLAVWIKNPRVQDAFVMARRFSCHAYFLFRYGVLALGIWLVAMVLLIAAYGVFNPPGSALMAIRWINGAKIDHRWVDMNRISPNLVRAVITSEDGRFCRHWGIDPKEIVAAIRRSRGGIPRGASTITMQLAKNLFLWPSKSYLRKVLEVPLTFAIELFWSKRRIMEVYLNVVEWGPGVFGAQSAARHHFKISARKLTAYQSSLLAVSLPNPLRRKARSPSRHVKRVARVVRARMKYGRHVARCVLRP